MPFTPSYLELCVKLYIGQENSKHLPGKYVITDLRLHSVYIACQCCYSVCKPDIDLVLDVHPVERSAYAYRNTSRAPRGRCLDPHVQVFLLDETCSCVSKHLPRSARSVSRSARAGLSTG